MSTLYENRPGGTIVHLADGTGRNVTYGTPYEGELDPANLKAEIAEDLLSHADVTPRLSTEDANLALARDAARRSALTDNGNVNSGGGTVPSNYGELDEDTCALLVMNLARYPEQQASVLYHEILFGGNRRKVIDAGSEYAFLAAQSRIAALMSSQKPSGLAGEAAGAPVTSPGDPSVRPGDPVTSAQFEARARAALGAQSLKDSLARRPTPAPAAESDGPSSGGDSPEDRANAAEADRRLAERERILNDREKQLDSIAAQLEERARVPAAGIGVTSPTDDTGNTGVPADRRTPPDGGDAIGFDGKDGVNSEGYWTNADIDAYARQHEITGVAQASNRQGKLDILTARGHETPQTPKP